MGRFLYSQQLIYALWGMLHYTLADFTVVIILAATLYGSALEAGLLSSNHPFHPFSTVRIGIRMEAPLSETP